MFKKNHTLKHSFENNIFIIIYNVSSFETSLNPRVLKNYGNTINRVGHLSADLDFVFVIIIYSNFDELLMTDRDPEILKQNIKNVT